jgi:two-component system LytT family response regulator
MNITPIQAALIDDEAHSRQTLRALLSDYCPQVDIVGEADGVLSGYKLLQASKLHVLFLDVQMEDGTGFDLLKKLPQPDFQVIFTTAYDEFAIKAFQYNAIDYLLKPIDIDELLRAVRKINPEQKTENNNRLSNLIEASEKEQFEKLALSSSEGLHFIELKEIVRLEANANYTSFYLASGEKITVARTIKNFERLLPATDFFRPHQSHMVNLAHVKKVERKDGGYLLMDGNFQVPIARSKKEELMGIVKERFLQ